MCRGLSRNILSLAGGIVYCLRDQKKRKPLRHREVLHTFLVAQVIAALQDRKTLNRDHRRTHLVCFDMTSELNLLYDLASAEPEGIAAAVDCS